MGVPSLYKVRVFAAENAVDGNSAPFVRVRPADPGLDVEFSDLSIEGAVAPSLEAINASGPYLSLQTDQNSTASAYWAPMPYAVDDGLLSISAQDASIQTLTDLHSPFQMIHASAIARADAPPRSIPNGGLALANTDQKAIIIIQNPLAIDLKAEVLIEPLGDGEEVFAFTGPGVIREADNHYDLLVPAKDYDNPGYQSYQYDLLINQNSNGARVTIDLKYPISTEPRLVPIDNAFPQPINSISIAEFEFTVAVVRIKHIMLHTFDEYGAPAKPDIYLDDQSDVKYPEYIRNVQSAQPRKGVFAGNEISPSAFDYSLDLTASVNITCIGINSFSLVGRCVAESSESSGSTLCPYGDLMETTMDCTSSPSLFKMLNGTASPNSVLATTNHYRWEVSDITTPSGQMTSDPISILETNHRIYSLEPMLDPELLNLSSIEIAFSGLEECRKSSSEAYDDLVRSCMTKMVYDSGSSDQSVLRFMNCQDF